MIGPTLAISTRPPSFLKIVWSFLLFAKHLGYIWHIFFLTSTKNENDLISCNKSVTYFPVIFNSNYFLGTGKSYLMRVIIEASKFILRRDSDDFKQARVAVTAPTANIVEGRFSFSNFLSQQIWSWLNGTREKGQLWGWVEKSS